MSQTLTFASVETESALIRAKLLGLGADIRNRIDPTVILDSAKATLREKTMAAPEFLKRNWTPISLLMLGGALGAGAVALASPRRSAGASPALGSDVSGAPRSSPAQPTFAKQMKTVLLSLIGVGLGYAASSLVPHTAIEDNLLGESKSMLRQRLDAFLQANLRGMQTAPFNLFGVSRLSAGGLVGLAMLAEFLLRPSQTGASKSA